VLRVVSSNLTAPTKNLQTLPVGSGSSLVSGSNEADDRAGDLCELRAGAPGLLKERD